MAKPLIRTNIFLSEFQREALKKRARKQHISAADLARRILDAYLGAPRIKTEPIKFKTLSSALLR
jgi:hypothetical protein